MEAYNQLVIHFQDRAVAYAYPTLGDFHTAMQKHPQAFNANYIAEVRRGEVEGCLDVVLQNLAR